MHEALKLNKPADFMPTAVTKETYLDVMEIAFQAYSLDAIRSRKKLNGDYLELQSYSRLTSVLACLISSGRMTDRIGLWEQMMTECCRELPTITYKGKSNFFHVYADFSIKEIMLAYKLMKPHIGEAKRKEWLAELRKVEPANQYAAMIRSPEDIDELHNINIYNMVGEYMRETEGLTDCTAYFAEHWPVQLSRFDENGMYEDPGCPVLYDLTTRCQIQLLLLQGYRGEYYEQIDRQLRKAGLTTLLMQSSAYEFPYGGRSNQFLFNEALIASNCEFEAARHKAEGNMELAGAFKRSGRLAVQTILRWLEESPPRHIKNFFPADSGYGTEDYAYYDRYMITMAAFLVIGYIAEDDSIEEAPCPAEAGGYVWETTDSFHKVFAGAAGYSLEIDTRADLHYDATGLGRLHRTQVPTELALSTPLSGGKMYRLPDDIHRLWSGISPGWLTEDGTIQYLSELSEGLTHELSVLQEEHDGVRFMLRYSGMCMHGCSSIREYYGLNRLGLRYRVEMDHYAGGKCYLRIPLLHTNGKETTFRTLFPGGITVEMGGYRYIVQFDGAAELLEDTKYGNRNGTYVLAVITSDSPSLSASFALEGAVE
jgi:hypothetical protein